MLAFREALEKILSLAPELGSERLNLGACHARVLAEDVCAATALPAFDYSAMDGYAVRSADFDGLGPWLFPIGTESRAGSGASALVGRTVCRIFTGAPLPVGADAVVLQEDVKREADAVRFGERPTPGEHVRRAGEDLAFGEPALRRGTRLGPFQLALAAAADRAELYVARRPRVGILCTGDELRAPGSAPRPASIPDSNGVALSALVTVAGGCPRLGPRVGDAPDAAHAAVESLLEGSDLLLTVGGVSVGEHDVMREALTRAGVSLEFWKVRMKPGKPLAFGRAGSALVLGLPGNPVSAQLSFALLGMPLLRRMQGDLRPLPERGSALLASAIRQSPGRLGFYRARLAGGVAHVFDNQASGSTVSLAQADALVVVPAESSGIDAGERVEVIRIAEL